MSSDLITLDESIINDSIRNRKLATLNKAEVKTLLSNMGMSGCCDVFYNESLNGKSLIGIQNPSQFEEDYELTLSDLLSKNKINEFFMRLSDMKQNHIYNYYLTINTNNNNISVKNTNEKILDNNYNNTVIQSTDKELSTVNHNDESCFDVSTHTQINE